MSGYPGDWLFTRNVQQWTFESSLRKQLPIVYQIFCAYSFLFFTFTKASRLKGGRKIFLALRRFLFSFSRRDYLQLHLPAYDVSLDLTDPRFFQVVNELIKPSIPQTLSALLSKGDTFVDVGANHGSFSLIASRLVGPEGSVVAIEPQPRLARAIEESLSNNASGPFHVHRFAVGNSNRSVDLLIPIGTSGTAGLYPAHSATHAHSTVTVPMKRLDDAMAWREFRGNTVVKLDIEGSEYAFLIGARKMITSLKPTLIIEINPGSLKASGTLHQQLKHLLQVLGYTRYAEFPNPHETFRLEQLSMDSTRNVVIYMT